MVAFVIDCYYHNHNDDDDDDTARNRRPRGPRKRRQPRSRTRRSRCKNTNAFAFDNTNNNNSNNQYAQQTKYMNIHKILYGPTSWLTITAKLEFLNICMKDEGAAPIIINDDNTPPLPPQRRPSPPQKQHKQQQTSTPSFGEQRTKKNRTTKNSGARTRREKQRLRQRQNKTRRLKNRTQRYKSAIVDLKEMIENPKPRMGFRNRSLMQTLKDIIANEFLQNNNSAREDTIVSVNHVNETEFIAGVKEFFAINDHHHNNDNGAECDKNDPFILLSNHTNTHANTQANSTKKKKKTKKTKKTKKMRPLRQSSVIKVAIVENNTRVPALSRQKAVVAKQFIPRHTILGQYFGDEYFEQEFEQIYSGTKERANRLEYVFNAEITIDMQIIQHHNNNNNSNDNNINSNHSLTSMTKPPSKKRKLLSQKANSYTIDENCDGDGQLLLLPLFEEYVNRYSRTIDGTQQVSFEIFIDGNGNGIPSKLIFVNDCRKVIQDRFATENDLQYQNVEFRTFFKNGWPVIMAITTKDILPNSEILTDYGYGFSAGTDHMQYQKFHKRQTQKVAHILRQHSVSVIAHSHRNDRNDNDSNSIHHHSSDSTHDIQIDCNKIRNIDN